MNVKKIFTTAVAATLLVGGSLTAYPQLATDYSLTASADFIWSGNEYTSGTYENLTYKKYADHVEISDCDKSVVEVVIPNEIDGVPVTIIGNEAFQYCYELVSVTIPEGVEEIGAYAFHMTALPKVVVPESVQIIGDSAFYIYGETTIKILNPDCQIFPSNKTLSSSFGYRDSPEVTIIGADGSTAQAYAETYGYRFIKFEFEPSDPIKGTDGIFNYLNYNDHIKITGLTGNGSANIVIPETIEERPVTEIGGRVFSEWAITSIVIPDSVTTIGEGAFYNCSKLKSVKMSSSVKSIPTYCFLNCVNMTECNIPEGVEWIGDYAFENTGLKTITLPSTLSSCSGWPTFCYNEYLTEFVVAEGNENFSTVDGVLVKKIYNSDELTHIVCYPGGREGPYTVPNGYTLSSETFAGCRKLTSLTLPDNFSVEYGFNLFFNDCDSLIELNVSEENPEIKSVDGVLYTKDGKELLAVPLGRSGKFTVPDGVTTVNDRAFNLRKIITEIYLPASVNEIGYYAFSAMENLSSITFENPNCIIPDNEYVIFNSSLGSSVKFNGTIYGYENSTAQAYAEKYGYNFAVIGDATTTTVTTTTTTATTTTTTTATTTTSTTTTSVVPPEEPEAILGDTNNDGMIDAVDASNILALYANISTSDKTPTEFEWSTCDVNGDGLIDAVDASLVLAYYAHTSTGGTLSFEEFMADDN